MTSLVITGGQLITPRQCRFTNLFIDGAHIEGLSSKLPPPGIEYELIDASGCYVTPGLFDLQVNGGPEGDLWANPSPEQLVSLRHNLALAGVTSFLPTLITDEITHLKQNLRLLSDGGAGWQAKQSNPEPALSRMPGIHLEGPCLSPDRHGVHPSEWLQPLSKELMVELANPPVSLVTLAPELEPSGNALAYLLNNQIRVALGHSNATAEEARQAFESGVHLMTHTFNALPALHHRAVGAVGAAMLDERVSCCLIADGLHVSPEMIRILIKVKGTNKTILVSDAAYTGTSQGGLVGSSIKLSQAVRNMVSWGAATFAQAIQMASWNPAQAMGWEQQIGHLCSGNKADIVLWNKQTLKIKQVFIGGQSVIPQKVPLTAVHKQYIV